MTANPDRRVKRAPLDRLLAKAISRADPQLAKWLTKFTSTLKPAARRRPAPTTAANT
ncbi:MAG TPA: hypothetical protein VGF55_31010 [Gemmataceae bacterium]|jgi:hypothetical protein